MADTTVIGSATETNPPDGGPPSSVDQAKETAKAVAQTTAGEAKSVVGEAKESARDLVGDARTQLRSQADDQAQRLAGTLRSFSSELSAMSQAPQAQGTAAEMARQAADHTQQLAQRLEQGGVDRAVADAKRFARTRPGTFLLGAMGAGFVVGRLIKNADTQALASAAKPTSDESSWNGSEADSDRQPMGRLTPTSVGTGSSPSGASASPTVPAPPNGPSTSTSDVTGLEAGRQSSAAGAWEGS
jgi:hypothetical protein